MVERYTTPQKNTELIPVCEPIPLKSNSLLRDVAKELQQSPIDWDRLIEETKTTTVYARALQTNAFNTYMDDGTLCEIYVGQVLRECGEQWGGIELKLPIPQYTQTEHYTFLQQGQSDNWTAVSNKHQKFIAEYDHLATMKGDEHEQDVLCAFEVKMTLIPPNKVMAHSYQNKLVQPLQELHEDYPQIPDAFGYAVVCPTYTTEAENQPRLIQRGGLYIPLPIDRKTFHREAEKVRRELRQRFPR